MNEIPISGSEGAPQPEQFYTLEEVARLTAISVTLVERFVNLNLVEVENRRLRSRDVARIAQMLRLRRDLGLNWVGAAMILDLSQELTQLKVRLRAYEAYVQNDPPTEGFP
jgi:hypothetical protein